jgi:hypothetical protein
VLDFFKEKDLLVKDELSVFFSFFFFILFACRFFEIDGRGLLC